jgi:serine/threonine-protein kinase RsbW
VGVRAPQPPRLVPVHGRVPLRPVVEGLPLAIMNVPVDSDVVVTVPSQAAFVHVLRSVAASVAARTDLPVDDIDDLRMAIDEASSQLLMLGLSPATLTLRLRAIDGGVEAVVSVDGSAPADWPPPAFHDSLAWNVLSALSDELSFELPDGAPAIRVVKRSSARSDV